MTGYFKNDYREPIRDYTKDIQWSNNNVQMRQVNGATQALKEMPLHRRSVDMVHFNLCNSHCARKICIMPIH